jgi:hypothetical protein
MIVAQRSLAAQRKQIECRILLFAQSSGPEVAPLAQDVVEGRLYAVTMNSIWSGSQDEITPFSYAYILVPLMVLNS